MSGGLMNGEAMEPKKYRKKPVVTGPASEATPTVDPQIVAAAMEAAGCYRKPPPQWIGFAQCGMHQAAWEDDQCVEVALIVRTVQPLILPCDECEAIGD